MIIYKTQQEIDLIAQSSRILAEVVQQVSKKVKPGIGTKELNDLAEKLISQNDAHPAFKGYKITKDDIPFPTALCTSINQEIVHAPAEPNRILKEGDIIGLDLGVEYKGHFSDMAVTVPVGQISQEAQKLINVTRECLALGLTQFKEGNTLYHVAKAIQEYVEANSFSIVRELVGHGVGKKVHEDPRIPNYITEEAKYTEIKKGMVVAIEPMVNIGDWRIKVL
ncbi:MAG: type I methionyl aminopeptidase, partial [Candidatus Buchananbacteria bacterium]|nr:type I methionyl aminopeptidase [Candidatus Buchananbacteria bacterium]